MRRVLLMAIPLLSLSLLSCGGRENEAPEPGPVSATTATATPAPSPQPAAGMPPAGHLLWVTADQATIDRAQGDATRRPKFIADAVNNQPALRFDGQDDLLEFPLDINPEGMPTLTIVTVMQSQTSVADPEYHKLYGHDDGGYDRAAGLDSRSQKNYTVFGGDSGVMPYFDLKASNWYITVDLYHENATFSGWVNGQSALDRAPVKHGSGLKTFFIGGTGTAFNEPWNGDVAEMIVYNRALSDSERTSVEDYLAGKYGIGLTRTPAVP
jgi:hypothetical protein